MTLVIGVGLSVRCCLLLLAAVLVARQRHVRTQSGKVRFPVLRGMQADFERVVAKSKPSVSPEDLERYTQWTAEFGVEGV